MLGIKPLDLKFTTELNKQVSSSIILTNDTDDYVAWRALEQNIYMDSPLVLLCMHPDKGIVPPRSSCIVTITLKALKKPPKEKCVGKLCVQSSSVDKGLTTKDITEDMFKEEPDKVVDMVNVMVSI